MKISLMKNFILTLSIILSNSIYSQNIERDSVVVLVNKAARAYQTLDTKKSLQYAQIALNQAYEINDNLLIAKTYNILGLNYTEYSEFIKAEEVFLKGLAAIEATDDIVVKSWLETNIANLYQVNFKDYNKAILYHFRSLENSKKLNSEYDILLTILNLGILHFDKHEYVKGYSYVKEAEKYLFKINEPEIFITYNSLNALYHISKKEYNIAEKFYSEALKYCDDEKGLTLTSTHAMELYGDISKFYTEQGDKSKGYDFLLKHIELKDSIYSKERSEAILNYVNKIDLDLYKREILKIEKLNDQQQRTIFYSKIVGGLLIFIALNLLFFVILLKRSQKQKNKLIRQIESKNIQLEISKVQAEELSELKSQFISNVSHELRTPLYGVIGLAKILEQDYPILKDNKILQALNFSADYLMNLINDLLQLQKIEANSVTLEKHTYAINHEIKNIVNSLSVIAHKNNNIIKLEQTNFAHEIIEVDKLKLNQILYNLISNALKFTHNGSVSITITEKQLSDKRAELTYVIEDTGSGISNENMEIIFEKFAQFNTKGSDYQGTGLGLPIVKQLVDIFGGTIELESEVDKGTKATFTIPCTIYKNQDELKNSKKNINLAELNIQVLLIENNEINRIVNQRNFENHNIPCTIVVSAKEALLKLEQNTYSIILTDINMPEIDGFMFTKMIREKGITTPVIALTAYSKQDIAQELEQTDIHDVVTKPYDFDYLLHVIYKNVIKN
jgi:signal transduction histidine kinase/CheY-like chemotaxis protein